VSKRWPFSHVLLCVLLHGALGALLSGCASAPELPRELEIQPGDLVEVTYHQSKARDPQFAAQDLVLRTLGNESREAIYSSSGRNVNAKVCEATDLQPLLDVMAKYGFFRRAGPTPEDLGQAAVSVNVNGSVRTWVRPDITQSATVAESELAVAAYTDFSNCMLYFMQLYNGIQGYASMNVTSEEEERRQREALERIREKHNIKLQPDQRPQGDGRP